MIFLDAENWFVQGIKQIKMEQGKTAELIAIVIDTEVADIIAIDPQVCFKLLNSTNFQECQVVSEENNLFCVSFEYMDTKTKSMAYDSVICNERFFSIFMSDPKFIRVIEGVHKYGDIVKAGWSYINEQFVIPGEYE